MTTWEWDYKSKNRHRNHKFPDYKVHIVPILRRPQNFAKSSRLALDRTKVRWRFCIFLWPSIYLWTLPQNIFFAQFSKKKVPNHYPGYVLIRWIIVLLRIVIWHLLLVSWSKLKKKSEIKPTLTINENTEYKLLYYGVVIFPLFHMQLVK